MSDVLNSGPGAFSRQKKKILLVVDNDPAQLYATGILLQRLDYNIYTAKTAEEALEIMGITVPSLMVTEAALPGMSGPVLLRQIKGDPTTRSVQVIVLTSSPNPVLKEDCVREGCAAYLRKPVDPNALFAAIQKTTEATPRSYVRLKISLPVLRGDGSPAVGSLSGDRITALSENGMYISTDDPQKAGTSLTFTIILETIQINVIGTVLYTFDKGKGPLRTAGMGIKFVQIKPEDQGLIRDFIKRELTQDLSPGKKE